MSSDYLFHPNQIIPTTKFVAAFMKFPYFYKSQMCMEIRAVSVEIFILCFRTGNRGVQI